MRYRRDDVIRWLVGQGCDYDGEPVPYGIGFFAVDGHRFVIPDPFDDGWLVVDLVEDVLRDRWIGTGIKRPTAHPDPA